ncbi:MAG: hypothetical protein JXD22_00350 [Sedimentisphaerales bacterium]|nr:hypothetical protein [Sedimentisphaerales bacterium]
METKITRAREMTCIFIVVMLLYMGTVGRAADTGTAFTYQGQLIDAGSPANGKYILQFKLYDDPNTAVGIQQGSTINKEDVEVTEGHFTVKLDFGNSVFDGDARWLEIGVWVDGEIGAFAPLRPRQELTPAPYALYALNGPGSTGFWSANGNDIYNTNSGNVGIGTAEPQNKLEVFGGKSLFVCGEYGNGFKVQSLDTELFRVDTDAYECFFENCNVGIGTAGAAPGAKLHVMDDVYRGYAIKGETSAEGSKGVWGCATGTSSTNYGVYGRTESSDGYAGYFTGGKNYFEGNVGIGTTTPAGKLDVNGKIKEYGNDLLPAGVIVMWGGAITSIPEGWSICDGTNGTPDLRDRFIVGAGNTYTTGETGGENRHTLSSGEMPSHRHYYTTNYAGEHYHTYIDRYDVDWEYGGIGPGEARDLDEFNNTRTTNTAGGHYHNGYTDYAGSSYSHENRPPYYSLAYIMKIQ